MELVSLPLQVSPYGFWNTHLYVQSAGVVGMGHERVRKARRSDARRLHCLLQIEPKTDNIQEGLQHGLTLHIAPGVPKAMKDLPSLSTKAGLVVSRGLFQDWTELA
jgi:hypothetical protein